MIFYDAIVLEKPQSEATKIHYGSFLSHSLSFYVGVERTYNLTMEYI